MHELRVAFVGCGGIAAHYLDVYRNLDWVKVTVCVDALPEVAERASRRLTINGATPSFTTDFSLALSNEVDVVVINTPNHLHRPQALAACEAGKHLLLQKPVANTIADADEIARAARRSERLSGLYMSYFDQPLLYDFREMAATGWFGRISHFYARLMHRGGLLWSNQAIEHQGAWRGSAAQTGGGCFIQLAVHYIHLLEWICREKIVRVSAMIKNLCCPGLEGEDLASSILEFESGTLATLDMNWSSYGEQLSIHGTAGSASYINNRLLMLESNENSFSGRVVDYVASGNSPTHNETDRLSEIIPPAMDDHLNPLNQHRLFLEAVRDGNAPFVTIESGVEDLCVVAAVYEAARTGRTVAVERG